MSQQPRVAQPETNDVPKEICDLVEAVRGLSAESRNKIDPLLNVVVESSKRRRRILNLVQDALSQLRVDMKYLMFDLEATRRERDDYRRQLEQA